MKASVIVPTYNSAGTLGECLESILRQEGIDFEVIVVDDGSTDNTRELVGKYPVRLITQEHRGPAAARNNGARNAVGEILVFTDSDCVVEDGWLVEMVRPFSDPFIVGVQGAYMTTQRELIARFAQYEIEERYDQMAKHECIDFIGSYSAGYRKDVFLEVGGFDEKFPIASGEDPDLSFRFAKLGYKMVFNPKAVVYHRHPDTLLGYLRQKFYRAYWRVALYGKNPGKAVRDSYTPQVLKVQIGLFYLVLLGFLSITLAISALVLSLATTLPTSYRMFQKDRPAGAAAPVLLFLRSAAFGFGLVYGAVSGIRDGVQSALRL
jgi:glycosyltransferase involved in cell wall biosynthesis